MSNINYTKLRVYKSLQLFCHYLHLHQIRFSTIAESINVHTGFSIARRKILKRINNSNEPVCGSDEYPDRSIVTSQINVQHLCRIMVRLAHLLSDQVETNGEKSDPLKQEEIEVDSLGRHQASHRGSE